MDEQRIAEIRERLEAATPGPWMIASDPLYPQRIVANKDGLVLVTETFTDPAWPPADADLIAHAPEDLADLLAELDRTTADLAVATQVARERGQEVERLTASERAARAERDSIMRRIDRLQVDEGWWVGGAWGDYGEAVVPLRALSTLTGPLADQGPEWETDSDFAATYGDLRATNDRLAAENAHLRTLLPTAKCDCGHQRSQHKDCDDHDECNECACTELRFAGGAMPTVTDRQAMADYVRTHPRGPEA